MTGRMRRSFRRWQQWCRRLPFWPVPAIEADLAVVRQLDGVMGTAMHRLSPEHQQLIAMRFGNGYTVAQIARATHRTKAAVRLDQLLALRALQHELESHAS
ncbi:MAG: sigma factor-like helix-turn-helix DNA-binding protein [Dehalococcoidia bacterium]